MASPEQFPPRATPKEALVPVNDAESSVAYLGVELPKAADSENAPKREQYADYINDRFSLELQKKIATSWKQGDPVLVEGGTSIGKTTTVKKMCADLGWEVHYVNLNGATDVEDLMGRYIPNHDRKGPSDPEYIFADGKITSGLRQEDGKIKVILLDEYNAAAPNILIRLHEVLDSLERNGEVVLAEDASEKIALSKASTKVVGLMNPPGRGYLQREPLDPAQIRRWVYLKEASELPDESLTHATRALFHLEGQTESVEDSAYLFANEAALTPEQFKEIPGIETILDKYLEFHKGAKELLASRRIAKDQPQRFLFDDRGEPKRVRDFIAAFYRGDINQTTQEALRYYYANKLLEPEDRQALEELIRTVEYVPPQNTKRIGIEAETTAAPETPAAPEAKLEGPVAKQIELAIEKLGKENVFGPKEVEKTFGVRIDKIPDIPFSAEELKQAEKLRQMLVLRVNKNKEGKPMSLEAMNAILMDKWDKAGKGGLLSTPDGWKRFVGDSYSKDAPRAGWALVSKEILAESLSKDYIQQTEILIDHLKNQIFKGGKMPENYRKAITTFESQKAELTRLVSDNWQEAAKRLAALDITQLTRQSLPEAIYDLAISHDADGKRLLADKYTWTSSLEPDGRLVGVGGFGEGGVSGRGRRPDGRYDDLGVSFSRR